MAQIFISIGSNINKEHYVSAAISELTELFGALSISNVYESEPVGFSGNNFYNLVVGATTEMSLDVVCKTLKEIEINHGRTPSDKKFAPRTLDLDLLVYDQTICQSPAQLPRDEITKNAFVLWPFAEVAAEFVHPTEQQTIAELWQNYDKSQQHLWKVEFNF